MDSWGWFWRLSIDPVSKSTISPSTNQFATNHHTHPTPEDALLGVYVGNDADPSDSDRYRGRRRCLACATFEDHRHSESFNELSIVIDTSNRDQATLIVHIDREEPSSLADRVESFLHDHDARTERERHGDAEIRVLATVESD